MIYNFRITLRDVTPTVWRRILISPEMSLEEFHYVIQTAMLWEAFSTYKFEVGGKVYGEPEEDEEEQMEEASVETIEATFKNKGDKGVYTYEMNEGWVMDIVLEEIEPKDSTKTYPNCPEGAQNAPPEESGGPVGYVAGLQGIKDPENPDRADLLEIFGENYDPNRFDRNKINAEFANPDNWEDDEDFEGNGFADDDEDFDDEDDDFEDDEEFDGDDEDDDETDEDDDDEDDDDFDDDDEDDAEEDSPRK